MSVEDDENDDLRGRIVDFLDRNFPQIEMHGGTAVIESLDAEAGEVRLRLGGACSGCEISPVTVRAIKSQVASEFAEIETVSTNPDGADDSTAEPPF